MPVGMAVVGHGLCQDRPLSWRVRGMGMSNEPVTYEGLYCANCGTPMQGEFCHACGQSIHSVLKPMHGMLEDTLDIVLHVDGRVVHTIPPLLHRPGFLTLEYFAGRRVRYVAPFRLMFVLCLLAFFLCHLALDDSKIQLISPETAVLDHAQDFRQQQTAAGVQQQLADELAALELKRTPGRSAASTARLERAEQKLRVAAQQRLIALGAAPAGSASALIPASGSSAAQGKDDDEDIGGANADDAFRRITQADIPWLPDFMNARLTQASGHMRTNILAIMHGGPAGAEAQDRIVAGVFGALPATMFVMLPVFAALLKLFYVFRRRLYMEHLIVALHSHAFLFLDLLLLILLYLLGDWLAPHAAWVAYPLRWLSWALLLWAPLYLLLMQKRLYRQGWAMTLLKFWCIGWLYFWLLLTALSIAVMLGLAH